MIEQSKHDPSSPSKSQSSKGKVLPLILGFGSVIVFVIFAFLSSKDQPVATATWTSALLILPVAAQVIGSVVLWDRVNSKEGNIAYYRANLIATSACIMSYCSLWLVYSTKWFAGSPNVLQGLSLLSLALVGGLLGVVGIMTAAFIMDRANTTPTRRLALHCETLRIGIRAEPLWAISLFFILFLGVAFLFGFALAFHDQYALSLATGKDRRPALRMTNLKSIDDPSESDSSDRSSLQDRHASQALNDRSAPSTSSEISDIGELGSESQDIFWFYFGDGEAHLRTRPYSKCIITAPPDRADTNLTGRRAEFNDCSLAALVDRIKKLGQGDKRVRVFLTGHTSDKPIEREKASQSYISNYELSEARAQNVRFDTLRNLGKDQTWHNVEWSILPASSEPLLQVAGGLIRSELFKNNSKELQRRFPSRNVETLSVKEITDNFTAEEIVKLLSPDERRIVAAVIEPVSNHVSTLQTEQIRRSETESQFKDLQLMDYMYFSIYTITTTGYGDIIPTTAYAKFITSLANICEVLFLVVFFNALISIKGNKGDDELKANPDPVSVQTDKKADSASDAVKKVNFGKLAKVKQH